VKSVIVKNGSIGANQIPVTVPDGCDALTAITKAGVNSSGNQYQVLVSADPQLTYSALTVPASSTSAEGWFVSADQLFPDIPVQAGKTLLVNFQLQSSATLFFNEAV